MENNRELEFEVHYSYSLCSEVIWANDQVHHQVGLPFNGKIKIKALVGEEAKLKSRATLECRIKTAIAEVKTEAKRKAGAKGELYSPPIILYGVKIGAAIQLSAPDQIQDMLQYVTNLVEEKFGKMKLGSYVPSNWPERPELKYDNRYFAEQLIPLILKVVQNKIEVGIALDLVAKKIECDGPHTVGPDTQQYGYAGDAYVTYVRTYPALNFALDSAILRQSIDEYFQTK